MRKRSIRTGIMAIVLSAAFAVTATMPAVASKTLADVGQPELRIPTLDEVNCASYCVYDKTADEIVLSKAPDDMIYPASMTKIMTAQLGLDYLDTSAYLTTSQNAIDNVTYDSTLMGLVVGERTTVSELLYGMMLPSGNDAANVVAEGVVSAFIAQYPAGGEEVGPDGVNASYLEEQLGKTSQEILTGYTLTAFAALMNLRAENLGCTSTHFVNANGLHDDDHYTTAYDLARIMARACENPDFCTVISSPTHIFAATNAHPEDGWSIVKNTNNLLNDPWLAAKTSEGEDSHLTAFIGGKTGTTSMAGTGMTVYTVNENGHELFISVCGIPGDFYAYQTRYVASVTAYGNLACWNNDPQTVIPGTTGDYRRFNSTDAELPMFDPLIVPGDSPEDYDPEGRVPEETEDPDETDPDETGAPDETGTGETTSEAEVADKKDEDSKLVRFVKDNLLIMIVIALLVILIILCIIILVTRSVSSRKKRKRKARPYTGKPDAFMDR